MVCAQEVAEGVRHFKELLAAATAAGKAAAAMRTRSGRAYSASAAGSGGARSGSNARSSAARSIRASSGGARQSGTPAQAYAGGQAPSRGRASAASTGGQPGSVPASAPAAGGTSGPVVLAAEAGGGGAGAAAPSDGDDPAVPAPRAAGAAELAGSSSVSAADPGACTGGDRSPGCTGNDAVAVTPNPDSAAGDACATPRRRVPPAADSGAVRASPDLLAMGAGEAAAGAWLTGALNEAPPSVQLDFDQLTLVAVTSPARLADQAVSAVALLSLMS